MEEPFVKVLNAYAHYFENLLILCLAQISSKPEFWFFFHSEIGYFTVKFRTFVLENNHLTIPFEQIYEIFLEMLPIFVAKKPKTKVISSKVIGRSPWAIPESDGFESAYYEWINEKIRVF